jgi:hypothetical protein
MQTAATCGCGTGRPTMEGSRIFRRCGNKRNPPVRLQWTLPYPPPGMLKIEVPTPIQTDAQQPFATASNTIINLVPLANVIVDDLDGQAVATSIGVEVFLLQFNSQLLASATFTPWEYYIHLCLLYIHNSDLMRRPNRHPSKNFCN